MTHYFFPFHYFHSLPKFIMIGMTMFVVWIMALLLQGVTINHLMDVFGWLVTEFYIAWICAVAFFLLWSSHLHRFMSGPILSFAGLQCEPFCRLDTAMHCR